jgi:alpha/beta hydrolase family protein
VSDRSIRLLPEGTKFKPLRIYELWYDARDPKVAGIGFAATRDIVSFLRYARQDAMGHPNPVDASAGTVRVLALGISQAGRYLRHHIELGMNADETGRRVFDGVLVQTAGIGKTLANHIFAESGRTATQHQDRLYPENWFPFAFTATTDPFTGTSGALFRGDDSDPLVIATNTSTEYWQKGASLLTTDPTGTRDLPEHPKVRTFLIAGTQHAGNFRTPSTLGPCIQPRNPHDAYPALRALLVALDEWVSDGKEPPASRVPRIADGTAVAFEALKPPKIPGIAVPATDNKVVFVADWTNPPAKLEKAYGTRVPFVDADGNETVGIRLPDQAVPLATLTGWNLYKNADSELCDREGTYAPFAKTKAERETNGDPRLSLAERYGSREQYVARIRAAAEALVRERLLLPTDADAYVRTAQQASGF